jgi:hypothetical protein
MHHLTLLAALGATLDAAGYAMADANCDREVQKFYAEFGSEIEASGLGGDVASLEESDVSDAFFFAHPAYVQLVEMIDSGETVRPARFLAADGVIECLSAHPGLSLAPEEIRGWAEELDATVPQSRRTELRAMMQVQ